MTSAGEGADLLAGDEGASVTLNALLEVFIGGLGQHEMTWSAGNLSSSGSASLPVWIE